VPLTLLRKLVPSLGYVSPNLDSATTIQQEHRFDVIYLDNQMVCHTITRMYFSVTASIQPVMSGLDVVRRLRDMGRTDFVVGQYC
jgi:osomolarity two-component system, sensor histidine kinase SLN1